MVTISGLVPLFTPIQLSIKPKLVASAPQATYSSRHLSLVSGLCQRWSRTRPRNVWRDSIFMKGGRTKKLTTIFSLETFEPTSSSCHMNHVSKDYCTWTGTGYSGQNTVVQVHRQLFVGVNAGVFVGFLKWEQNTKMLSSMNFIPQRQWMRVPNVFK